MRSRSLPAFAAPCLVVTATLAPLCPIHAADFRPPIWTGTYAGLHGGMNWMDVEADAHRLLGGADPGATLGLDAGQFGGHIGLNFAAGMAVLGGEAEINIETGDVKGSANGAGFGLPSVNATASVSASMSGSLRLRAGFPVSDSTLLYATAGYAWTNIDYAVSGTAGGTTGHYASSMTFDGIAYGVGAETFITPNLVLRVEALRTDYASRPLALPHIKDTGVDINASSDAIRAGLSWHFN